MINSKIAERLARRIRLMIGRAVLSAVTDTGARQFLQVQVLKGETKDNVERLQEYGFTSHPVAGAAVIVAALGGTRDNMVAIAVDDPTVRPRNLQPGETCLYNNKNATLVLDKDGNAVLTVKNFIVKAEEKVRFETPLMEVTGELIDLADGGGMRMSQMRETYNEHHHGGSPDADPQMDGGA